MKIKNLEFTFASLAALDPHLDLEIFSVENLDIFEQTVIVG